MQLVLHMVFKVAKAMAPAVIFIDDVEKVFMKAKKKKKDGSNSPQSNTEGEENKKGVAEVAIMMRKELLAQINMLQPGKILYPYLHLHFCRLNKSQVIGSW